MYFEVHDCIQTAHTTDAGFNQPMNVQVACGRAVHEHNDRNRVIVCSFKRGGSIYIILKCQRGHECKGGCILVQKDSPAIDGASVEHGDDRVYKEVKVVQLCDEDGRVRQELVARRREFVWQDWTSQ